MATTGGGTVGKALELLTLVGEFPAGGTAAQVAQRVDYPFSTVHRLLTTLVETEFLSYDPRDRRYSLGLPVFQLGQQVAYHRGFTGTVHAVLQELTERTGESSVLSVLDRGRALTVHTVDGPQFRTTTDPGDHSPLHTSANGKVLLAFSDPETAERLLRSVDLVPRTEHSITDREVLARQLAEARAQGWAGQSEENDVGMAAIAVPVQAPSRGLIGALALAAPLFRCDLEGLREHLPALRAAAHQLSIQLPQG
ncbi:IclR family transcriptional regulator [Citricoccus sp. SGAir0253]|uniref:IclR family transcriptional regulator n=1 Tax=Citricoccus sp. SGAir0253 TaxID=2567881 RepID=UPI0010CD0158|nr:IclR family transcriptional regulator [Citricoccus sp. SGAir0253]QCU78555.1 IclR family transcriptional regulator [Citricoccus sp. SGAir0253]